MLAMLLDPINVQLVGVVIVGAAEELAVETSAMSRLPAVVAPPKLGANDAGAAVVEAVAFCCTKVGV